MADPLTTAAEWDDETGQWCANLGPDLPRAGGAGAAGRKPSRASRTTSGRAWRPVPPPASGTPARTCPRTGRPSRRSPTRGVHAVLARLGARRRGARRPGGRLRADRRRARAGAGRRMQRAAALGTTADREHFGFRDGISQPTLRGSGLEDAQHADRLAVAPGEFVLGYPDELGNAHDARCPRCSAATAPTPSTASCASTSPRSAPGWAPATTATSWPRSSWAAGPAARRSPSPPGRRPGAGRRPGGASTGSTTRPTARASPARAAPTSAARARATATRPTGPAPAPPRAALRRPAARGRPGRRRTRPGRVLPQRQHRAPVRVRAAQVDQRAQFDGLHDESDPVTGSAGRDFTWQRRPRPAPLRRPAALRHRPRGRVLLRPGDRRRALPRRDVRLLSPSTIGRASCATWSSAVTARGRRSRTRNRNRSTCSPRPMMRLRACCVVHAPSGCAVTPRCRAVPRRPRPAREETGAGSRHRDRARTAARPLLVPRRGRRRAGPHPCGHARLRRPPRHAGDLQDGAARA